MSSVQYLREFVSERLTAAAEEIFGVFEKTIVEYEAEIDRQRRLLDIVWKPEIKLHRIELPQQHVCKEEEVLTDQQLWNQHRNSSLDPEPPQVKEEQEEVCTSQEGEQLVLKQETQTFMLSPTHEESEHSEPEPNRDHQLLSHCSAAAENQDQRGGQHVDPGPTRDAESMTKKRRHNNRRHRNKVDNSDTTKSLCETHTGTEALKCDTCGKTFKYNYYLNRHLRIHTGEKPYPCKTCGRRFCDAPTLKRHMRTHTGEKPYSCQTCGKCFRHSSSLLIHVRTHTGEKPYSCATCGKRFHDTSSLNKHLRIHSGDKLFSCKTCGKCFKRSYRLLIHVRTHTDEKQHLCKICGKRFINNVKLKKHMTIHSGETPYMS